MRKTWIMLIAVALVAAPTAALAKGASKAKVEGKGLGTPIVIGGNGEPGSGDTLAIVADQTGLYGAMFREYSLDSERPSGDLGPAVTITFVVPGPEGPADRLVQRLYPYTEGGPVAFTEAGQEFFSTEKTAGGWYRSPEALVDNLQSLGLPSRSELIAGTSDAAAGTKGAETGVGATSSTSGLLLALLAGVLVVGAGLMMIRRRTGPGVAG